MKSEKPKSDFPTEIVKEGRVKVLVPRLSAFVKEPSEYAPSKAPVFYNPVMELNRDIAVLALQAYQRMVNREICVCEPLTGCGVRGVRFAAEVDGVKKVLINDINPKASELAKYNVQLNALTKCVSVKNEDANLFLSRYAAPRKRFDAIDIDPFGSPAPFLDSAVRALRDDGLLAVTATDMAPLCGVHPKACIRKYGGKPLHTEYCHEIAVRLVAGCLATTAAKHDMGVNILFSHSTNHYVRIYAKVNYGATKADESVGKLGYILHCFNCFHRETVSKPFTNNTSSVCPECGSEMDFAGPLWLGKIFHFDFCELMEEDVRNRDFEKKKKIRKILSLARNEVDAPPNYYVIDKICDKLGFPVPSVKEVIRALREKGFQSTLTHFNPKGIKTNAPSVDVKKTLQELHSVTVKRYMTNFK
ncbi:MAG: tRNA (guanine(10)-N(2))-dimethyltransferase [Candidatus Bathyarchaeia archaeon]